MALANVIRQNSQENTHIQMMLYQAVREAHFRPSLAVLESAVMQTWHDSSNAAYQWHFDFKSEPYRDYYGIAPVGEKESYRSATKNVGDIKAIADELRVINHQYLKEFLWAGAFNAQKFTYVKPYKIQNSIVDAADPKYIEAADLKTAADQNYQQTILNQAVVTAQVTFNARFG